MENENYEDISVVGVVMLKTHVNGNPVKYARPIIRDEKTGVKYDLPVNCERFADKKVCIEGHVMQTKQVGDKIYNKLWVDSVVVI